MSYYDRTGSNGVTEQRAMQMAQYGYLPNSDPLTFQESYKRISGQLYAIQKVATAVLEADQNPVYDRDEVERATTQASRLSRGRLPMQEGFAESVFINSHKGGMNRNDRKQACEALLKDSEELLKKLSSSNHRVTHIDHVTARENDNNRRAMHSDLENSQASLKEMHSMIQDIAGIYKDDYRDDHVMARSSRTNQSPQMRMQRAIADYQKMYNDGHVANMTLPYAPAQTWEEYKQRIPDAPDRDKVFFKDTPQPMPPAKPHLSPSRDSSVYKNARADDNPTHNVTSDTNINASKTQSFTLSEFNTGLESPIIPGRIYDRIEGASQTLTAKLDAEVINVRKSEYPNAGTDLDEVTLRYGEKVFQRVIGSSLDLNENVKTGEIKQGQELFTLDCDTPDVKLQSIIYHDGHFYAVEDSNPADLLRDQEEDRINEQTIAQGVKNGTVMELGVNELPPELQKMAAHDALKSRLGECLSTTYNQKVDPIVSVAQEQSRSYDIGLSYRNNMDLDTVAP